MSLEEFLKQRLPERQEAAKVQPKADSNVLSPINRCEAFLAMAGLLEPNLYDFRETNVSFDPDSGRSTLINERPIRYKVLSNDIAFFELQHPKVVSGEEYSLQEAFEWSVACAAFKLLVGVAPFSAPRLFEIYQRIMKRSVSQAVCERLREAPQGAASVFFKVLAARPERVEDEVLCESLECELTGMVGPLALLDALRAVGSKPYPSRVEQLERALREKTRLLEEAIAEIEALKRRLAMYEGDE